MAWTFCSTIFLLVTIQLSHLHAQNTCTYTFNVPVESVQQRCEVERADSTMEEIKAENSRIIKQNERLLARVEAIEKDYAAMVVRGLDASIVTDYASMVTTVRRLDADTAAWRESVHWPVFSKMEANMESAELVDANMSYEDCYRAVRQNGGREGVYSLLPSNAQHPHLVYCSRDGWTVVLRRFDGSLDFYRNWQEFSGGFGRPPAEHWVGLELLHLLTKAEPHELSVEVLGWNDKLYSTIYPGFRVGDEMGGYELTVGSSAASNVSAEWDSGAFTKLSGRGFTTRDKDNDAWDRDNCASYYRGGWWLGNCEWDPSRERCNGQGCMSWGDHIASKILLKMRAESRRGANIANPDSGSGPTSGPTSGRPSTPKTPREVSPKERPARGPKERPTRRPK